MADIVEYRLEKTYDDLKALVDLGLFDENHVKEIVGKREQFEYTLRRRTKCKLEYTKYIRYEWNLLNSIENYKKTMLSKAKDLEDEIDVKICKLQAKKLKEIIQNQAGRTSVLFRKLTTRNQFDKRLWMTYIEFCKERKWHSRVSTLYWRLLRVASEDESLWIAAASYEINVRKEEDLAKKLYLLALRHHPKSSKIIEKFSEICDAETLKKYRETIEEEKRASKIVGQPGGRDEDKIVKKQLKMDLLYECYENDGIVKAREAYEQFDRFVRGQTLSLYVGMIQVECWQFAEDKSEEQKNRVRAIYERALSKFGRSKPKLWYEYLQFEHEHAKSLDDFQRINSIYTRAQAELPLSMVDRVIDKYTMLQSNQSKTDIDYSDYSDLDE